MIIIIESSCAEDYEPFGYVLTDVYNRTPDMKYAKRFTLEEALEVKKRYHFVKLHELCEDIDGGLYTRPVTFNVY